jgi:hypothetical protein
MPIGGPQATQKKDVRFRTSKRPAPAASFGCCRFRSGSLRWFCVAPSPGATSAHRRAFRTEGPLCLNPGEEPLQHEAGAEELSAPVLTQGGSGPVGGTSAGGKGSPTGRLTGTPTRGHALAQWASAEGTQSSTAEQGGGRGRGWRRYRNQTIQSPLLVGSTSFFRSLNSESLVF